MSGTLEASRAAQRAMFRCTALRYDGHALFTLEPDSLHPQLMERLAKRLTRGKDVQAYHVLNTRRVEEGFLLQDGRFVDRYEAAKLAPALAEQPMASDDNRPWVDTTSVFIF